MIVFLFSGTEICGAPRATISSSRNVTVTAGTATSGGKLLCWSGEAHYHYILFRKDLDFVPAPPNNNEAGAAGGAQAAAVPDKKKKKDKANLKPKLNFNPHSVTGSYFGSKRQKEDEEVTSHGWPPSLPVFDLRFIAGIPAAEAAEAEPGAEQVGQCQQ